MNDSSTRGRLGVARTFLRACCRRLGGRPDARRGAAPEHAFGEPRIQCLSGARRQIVDRGQKLGRFAARIRTWVVAGCNQMKWFRDVIPTKQ